ncbi:MAG: ribosomal L7Ae/L30e/S12e/Gadd45 family protein [Gemmatimonadetes bacterium]|nr:ribosomal L7Ae/L30e/S12e/Gadd45 family protein [Gemmatimonadota bacterium]
MDAHLARRLAGLLGLGARGRLVVSGVEQVRVALRQDDVALLIVADDAAEHSRDKVLPLATAKKVPVIEGPSAVVLGRAVGKEQVAAVGVTDRRLAKGIRELMESGPTALAPAAQ